MSIRNELLASQRILSMLENACEYSEQVLDNVPSVFVVLNGANQVIRSNRTFCDLVDKTMSGILRTDFTSYFSHESRESLLRCFHEVRSAPLAKARTSAKLELECAGEGGAAKPFFWRMFRLEHLGDVEGQVITVIGSDLSELYQSELKLMSIFASIPLGLLIVDRHGLVMEVLSEYCQVLLQQSDLVGHSLAEVLARSNGDRRLEIVQTFEHLRAHADKPVSAFQAVETSIGQLDAMRIALPDGSDRWIRARFQPVVKNQRVDHYLVVLEDVTAHRAAQTQIERADLLGRQAKALYECAIRDPLSGLYTRLFMNDSLPPLIASARRGNFDELALLMLDIDHFKRINDTWGHDAGDRVIRAVGQIIKSCIRETDVPIRYGGEEFIVALPSNDSHELGGSVVAERIRSKLESTPIAVLPDCKIQVTASCGVAYCRENDSLEGLIQRADHHLYQAKQTGRNRVCAEENLHGATPCPASL